MNIAVIGNIVYDMTVRGESIKVNLKNNYNNATYNTGGPASTAASVLAKYGSNVEFYGQVGKDVYGEYTYNTMKGEGINMNHVNVQNNLMTPFGFISVDKNTGERTIFSVRDPKDTKIYDVEYKDNYDIILTDGKYATETLELIKRNKNAISIIDAGRVNENVLSVCNVVDYIICSEEFANKVTDSKISDGYFNNLSIFNALKNKFPNSKGITITIGKNGYICEENGIVVVKPAYEPEEKTIDTNGAGDIFHGAFTYALANNLEYLDALSFANVTAALSTTKIGGRKSVPELEEVKAALKQKQKIYK